MYKLVQLFRGRPQSVVVDSKSEPDTKTPSITSPKPIHILQHDNIAHHPLGGGSYVFKDKLTEHISQSCIKDRITLQIGCQPNSSPHMGTVVTFAVAFFLAQSIQRERKDCHVSVVLDLVDTAPSEQMTVDGVRHQRSQRFTGEMNNYMADFVDILDALSTRTGVEYRIRTQAEFLADASVPAVLNELIQNRTTLGPSLSPKSYKLAIRSACPHPDCGLADKDGINNVYIDDHTSPTTNQGGKLASIQFTCPTHGAYTLDLSNPQDVQRLEFNTPLRNLLRAKVFSRAPTTSWVRVTGADYAGYYQEQLLWRHLHPAEAVETRIVYSPLIVDWSGAKLSKSLYVKEGAYGYLEAQGMDYLVSYEVFRRAGMDLGVVLDEVEGWVRNPYRLFRSYSIAYFHALFGKDKPVHGHVGKK